MKFWLTFAALGLGVTATAYALIVGPMHSSVETADVAKHISVSARAPFMVSMKGAAYAIMAGELDGRARVVVTGSGNYGTEEFVVGPGKVAIACGGAEAWIDGYKLEYFPLTAASGHLYISVYCGKLMSEQDRRIHYEIVSARR